MKNYSYILEPYKGITSRHTCPCCGKQRVFSRYIHTDSGLFVADHVGRCNRENECSYHYTPKQYFQDNNIQFERTERPAPVYTPPPPVSLIPSETFKASLQGYESNNFVLFLIGLFGTEKTIELIERYFIGTSKHWHGSVIFWQIDKNGGIRTGKIMLYNPTTGKRVKEPYNHITWVHKALKCPEFNLKQCLFGEYLLIDKTKPVAVTESEKTAIIASVYLPQFIWLAAGSINNLSIEKCQVLAGRKVVLFPDLNAFDKWKIKASELSQIMEVSVSDLLEREASEDEKKHGYDLADYLVNFDIKDFLQPKNHEAIEAQKSKVILSTLPNTVTPTPRPVKVTPTAENWTAQISELETLFSTVALPTQPIKLNPYTTITNVKLFIDSHLNILKTYNGNRTFLPHLNRLEQLKTLIAK